MQKQDDVWLIVGNVTIYTVDPKPILIIFIAVTQYKVVTKCVFYFLSHLFYVRLRYIIYTDNQI